MDAEDQWVKDLIFSEEEVFINTRFKYFLVKYKDGVHSNVLDTIKMTKVFGTLGLCFVFEVLEPLTELEQFVLAFNLTHFDTIALFLFDKGCVFKCIQ